MTIVRPDLGSAAEELYRILEPFHTWSDPDAPGQVVTDAALGWPLLVYWGTVAKRWQEIEDLARDSSDGPGWSTIVDLDRIPDKGLEYIGQFKGKTFPAGMTPDQKRDRIRGTDGFERGTAEALRVAAKRHLTPPVGQEPYVIVNERLGGNLWQTGVVTLVDETPDPVLTFNDMLEQKHHGIKLFHEVVDAYGYLVLRVAFDDYGEIRTHYADYEGIRDNDPPAPIV